MSTQVFQRQVTTKIRGLAALLPKKGLVEVDFGAWPGSTEAGTAVSFPSVSTSGPLTAWVQAVETVDHSADEHRIETITAMAGNAVPGVGFTVYARSTGPWRLYGLWSVGWTYYGT